MYFNVRVKTNSRKNLVKKLSENSYLVEVKAKPIRGKANTEVIKVLAKYLKVRKNKLVLSAGHKISNKIFILEQ